MTDQPPLTCPKPTCGFPSITIGERDGRVWAACVGCCSRREDWEEFLDPPAAVDNKNESEEAYKEWLASLADKELMAILRKPRPFLVTFNRAPLDLAEIRRRGLS